MAKCPVINIEGKKAGEVDLPDAVFSGRINSDVIHQSVVMYQASLRQGNASTKERAYVSGGGKKPYRQKGTGRARVGSSRSPLWSGGGVTFGPHPRDFDYTVPKKIRKAALRESLKAKFNNDNLVCIDDDKKVFTKTKEFAQILKKLEISDKTLAVLDGFDPSIQKVTRNIPRFQLMRAQDVNAYDVMKFKKIIVSKTALQSLLERVTK